MTRANSEQLKHTPWFAKAGAACSIVPISRFVGSNIFALKGGGYRPLTFEGPPPTWREGPDDRISLISERVGSGMPSLWNHANRSSCPSTVPPILELHATDCAQRLSLSQFRLPLPLLGP